MYINFSYITVSEDGSSPKPDIETQVVSNPIEKCDDETRSTENEKVPVILARKRKVAPSGPRCDKWQQLAAAKEKLAKEKHEVELKIMKEEHELKMKLLKEESQLRQEKIKLEISALQKEYM